MNVRTSISTALCIMLAACGGGGHAGLPPVGHTRPSSGATAALSIVIPHPSAASSQLRPAYVSPSSATLAVAVNGGTPATYGLTASSPGCSVVQGNTQCVLQVPAPAGDDSLTLTIEDGVGNVLSKNIVNAKLASGVATPVNVTLAGIPASVAIVPGSGSTIEDSANPAWHVPGLLPQPVEVEALDADGNIIVGPGAPVIGTPTVTAGSSYAKIVSAQTTDPNAYLLESTSGSAGGQTVTVSATAQSIALNDGTHSPPATSSTNFLYTPAVAIVNGTAVDVYSVETTNLIKQFSVCGGGCFGLTFGRAAASDANGDLFFETVSSLGISLSYAVFAYGEGSTSVANAYSSTNGVTGPGGIAADSHGTLYAVNGVAFTGSFPHRRRLAASLNTIPWGATSPATTLTDAAPTYLTGPVATAIDKNGQLYVVNQDDTIDIYPAGATSIVPTTVITASAISQPAGIAVDGNGGIYVFDSGNSDIAYFAPGSTTITNTISDPSGSFYSASGTIWFDGNGNLNVSMPNSNETEILAGSGLPNGTVTYLGFYRAGGPGAWIP